MKIENMKRQILLQKVTDIILEIVLKFFYKKNYEYKQNKSKQY